MSIAITDFHPGVLGMPVLAVNAEIVCSVFEGKPWEYHFCSLLKACARCRNKPKEAVALWSEGPAPVESVVAVYPDGSVYEEHYEHGVRRLNTLRKDREWIK